MSAKLRHDVGDPKAEKAKFDEISPLRSVDNIKIPVFIAHGRDDPLIDVNQSQRLARALQDRRIPHEVLLESGEAHDFRRLDSQIELRARIETFLAKNLTPDNRRQRRSSSPGSSQRTR